MSLHPRLFSPRLLTRHHHHYHTSLPSLTRSRTTSSAVARSALRRSPPIRPLHQASSRAWPRKSSQDKDSINREPMEYTRSGSDQGVAEMEEAAFDPDITRPEEEQKKAGEGTGVSEQSKPKDRDGSNPMDVSPANPDVSKTTEPDQGGAEHAPGERRVGSGGGSGMKGKK